MRQFNYYGQTRLGDFNENDIEGLQNEIEYIIRNQLGGGSPNKKFNDYEDGTEKVNKL